MTKYIPRQGDNGSGNVPGDWDAFDRLPSALREFLRYAPVKYSPSSIMVYYINNGRPPMGMFLAYLWSVLEREYPRVLRERDKDPDTFRPKSRAKLQRVAKHRRG